MKYINALADKTIEKAKPNDKPYKLVDGEGLYVLVSASGSKYWRYDYRFEGIRKTMALGVYPAVSLKSARAAHDDAVKMLRSGIDPSAAKQEEKRGAAGSATFREVSAEWLKLRAAKRVEPEDGKKSKTGNRDVLNVGYLNADLGDKAMADLEVPHLAAVLNKFEAAGKYETRVRVQGTAIDVARYAVGKGIIKTNPFAGTPFYAAYTAPADEPRPAITDPEAFGHLLRKIDHFEGREGNITGIALKLLALTFIRPGELTGGKWAHVDFDGAKMEISAEDLKMRTHRKNAKSARANKSHEVPLSRQALSLFRDLHRLTGRSEYLFPGRQGSRTISENTINNALVALGYQGTHCAHGFRSSASTLLNSERVVVNDRRVLLWPDQAALIEVQLDHEDASTRAIYNRGGLWEDRAEMMQHWADLVDRLRSSNGTGKRASLRVVAAA